MTHRTRRLTPLHVAVLLWLAAFAVETTAAVGVTHAAKAAHHDTAVTYRLFNLPLLQGFRHADRFGIHPLGGSLVLFLFPAVAGLLVALGQYAATQRSGTPRGDHR